MWYKAQRGRLSPIVDNAVNDDDQGKDEHEHPKADGDELLQFGRPVTAISEDEAAFAHERGRAAADHTGKILWVHSKCEHEPTRTRRDEAAIYLNILRVHREPADGI